MGILAILLAVFALLLVSWSSTKAATNSPKQLVEPLFDRIFGSLSPVPALKISSSYGYPTFDVTFGSRSQMESAAIQQAEFLRELGILLKDCGATERRFDAEMAVFFTYPGHVAEVAAAYGQKREPNRERPVAP